MDQFFNQYSFVIGGVFLWLLLALLLVRRKQPRRTSAIILGVVGLFMVVFWIISRPVQTDEPDAAAVRARIGAGGPVLIEIQSPYCLGCLRAKPIVDALETELAGKLTVIRLDIQGQAGRDLGQQFDFRYTPTFVLLNGSGAEVGRWIGTLDPKKVKELLVP